MSVLPVAHPQEGFKFFTITHTGNASVYMWVHQYTRINPPHYCLV